MMRSLTQWADDIVGSLVTIVLCDSINRTMTALSVRAFITEMDRELELRTRDWAA